MDIETMIGAVDELHIACDCHSLPNLSAEITPAQEEAINAMVKKIFEVQSIDGLDVPVVKIIANDFWKAVTEGYGKDIIGLDFDTPDYNMLEHLRNSVYQFSGAKNYQQLRELTSALVSPEGKLRTFEEFKAIALTINDRYMKTWLQAEYNLAVAGGQMASKWVDIERNSSELPLLQFDAVLDNQTTALCRSLDGTILPINHAFWKTYFPPNHYNCRSTVRQIASGKQTPARKIPSADIPPMFRTNLAQHNLIFPEDHPYFIGAPQWALDQAKNLIPKK
jgi:SPP1 gp7 family putative phage head morphogenesis protein